MSKQVIVMRRKIRSGKVTEVSQFFLGEKKSRRPRVKGSSSAAKKDSNLSQAVRRLGRTLNCNLSSEWLLLTLKYEGALPATREDAERNVKLFIRRLARRGVKFSGVWITADRDAMTKEPVRLHHHMLIRLTPQIRVKQVKRPNSDKRYLCAWLGSDTLEDIWGHGQMNVRRIADVDDYSPLAVYFVEQAVDGDNVKKWHASHGLEQPEIISEEILDKAEALRAPGGADIKEMSEYDEEFGTHYIRYVARPDRAVRNGYERVDKKAVLLGAKSRQRTERRYI